MTRQKALTAIDDAFCDGIKLIYERLVSNIIAQSREKAANEFVQGLDNRHKAYSIARSLVEKVFPE
jgi:hypothetical protein